MHGIFRRGREWGFIKFHKKQKLYITNCQQTDVNKIRYIIELRSYTFIGHRFSVASGDDEILK